MIVGKSNHPVFIKKINLEVWTFRNELTYLISKAAASIAKGEDQQKINIEKIKEYYKGGWWEAGGDAGGALTDTAGNPMDEAAMEMAAAMGGGEEAEEEASEDDGQAEMDQDAIDAMMSGGGGGDASEEAPAAEAADTEAVEEGGPLDLGEDAQAELQNKIIQYYLHNFRKRPELPKEQMARGEMILADIDIDGALFFCNQEFIGGQTIVIHFLVPQEFILSCEVINCKRINFRSRIIALDPMNYRVQARFTFQTKGERSKLRDFLASIMPDLPKAEPKRRVQDDDDEDDDFDDLGI